MDRHRTTPLAAIHRTRAPALRGAEEDTHRVRQRRHHRSHRQHLQPRAHAALPREERARGADEKKEDAADDESNRQRANAREGRPEKQPAEQVAEDRDRAADQRRDAGDETLTRRVLELGSINAQLFASLRLQPYLLVLRDPIDDRLRLGGR